MTYDEAKQVVFETLVPEIGSIVEMVYSHNRRMFASYQVKANSERNLTMQKLYSSNGLVLFNMLYDDYWVCLNEGSLRRAEKP